MTEHSAPHSSLLTQKWAVVAATLVCAVPLWLWRGSPAGPGDTIEVHLTLVSSDKDDLACGSDGEFAGFRCQFTHGGEPVEPASAPEKILAPYMDHQRNLFLIPDLFASEALRQRYDEDSSARIPRKKRKRFDAICKLRLVQEVEGISVRWVSPDKVSGANRAWVGTVEHCRINDR